MIQENAMESQFLLQIFENKPVYEQLQELRNLHTDGVFPDPLSSSVRTGNFYLLVFKRGNPYLTKTQIPFEFESVLTFGATPALIYLQIRANFKYNESEMMTNRGYTIAILPDIRYLAKELMSQKKSDELSLLFRKFCYTNIKTSDKFTIDENDLKLFDSSKMIKISISKDEEIKLVHMNNFANLFLSMEGKIPKCIENANQKYKNLTEEEKTQFKNSPSGTFKIFDINYAHLQQIATTLTNSANTGKELKAIKDYVGNMNDN